MQVPKLPPTALVREGEELERAVALARYEGGSSARILCFESVPYLSASVAPRENQNSGIKINLNNDVHGDGPVG
jgi:hypothetical protein